MSAKLIRQPDQLALVGVPTSAGSAQAGVEAACAALRAAGMLSRLKESGYRVNDAGDLPRQVFQPDPESPRARNVPAVLAVLEALKSRIELITKARGLPVVLGGDSTVVMGLVAGLRRQASALGLVYFSRHADLRTPLHTQDGLVDPMTVSHLVGQGAAEMVRFWKEPPLVREPDLALFGLGAPDAIDQLRLSKVAVRGFSAESIRRTGARAVAESALEKIRAADRDFVVHLSLDAISRTEFAASDRGAEAGLSLAEAAEALAAFLEGEKLAGLSISGFHPALDPDGRYASVLIDLLASALAARRTALLRPASAPAVASPPLAAPAEMHPQQAEAAEAATPPQEKMTPEPAAEVTHKLPQEQSAPGSAIDSTSCSEPAPAPSEPASDAEAGPAIVAGDGQNVQSESAERVEPSLSSSSASASSSDPEPERD